jgi:hypothetical protein
MCQAALNRRREKKTIKKSARLSGTHVKPEAKRKGRNFLQELQRGFRVLWLLIRRTNTPHKLALGFALGVGLSFFPVPFLGMFLALGLALLFRLNIISTYIGTLIVNPVTGILFYGIDYAVGVLVSGGNISEAQRAMNAVSEGIAYLFRFEIPPESLIMPLVDSVGLLYLGGAIVGVVGGLIGYALVFAFASLANHRRKKKYQQSSS